MENVFDCKMCGQCCTGSGGIVVSPKDLERLCNNMGIEEEEFRTNYGVMHNNKLKVATGMDGRCIFFKDSSGCSVHVAKPDICRAWPFFRGNLIDPVSLSMAKEYCPGINKDVSFMEFSRQGKEYLEENSLINTNKEEGANALLL